MALFGKTPEDKTFLILDIENGSVGSGLARFSPATAPKLMVQTRLELPLTPTVSSATLAADIERTVGQALSHTSLVAGRLRNAHPTTAPLGEIGRAAVFLGAPWGAPNLNEGRPDFVSGMQDFIRQELASYIEAPISFYTFAGAASHGIMHLYPQESTLVLIVQGELLELLLVSGTRVEAYATLPWGYRSLMRTLQTHGGLTSAEARSALNLTHTWDASEPMVAAGAHVSNALRSSLEQLIVDDAPAQVVVLSHGAAGEWLARALAESDMIADFFPQGAHIRALKSPNLTSHVSTQGTHPDLMLMLDALYLDQKFI